MLHWQAAQIAGPLRGGRASTILGPMGGAAAATAWALTLILEACQRHRLWCQGDLAEGGAGGEEDA
jgi:hypothetical protein